MWNIFSRSEGGKEDTRNTEIGIISSPARVKTSSSTEDNSSLDMLAYLSISIIASFIAIAGVLAVFKPIRAYSKASEAIDLGKEESKQTSSKSSWSQSQENPLTLKPDVPPSPTVSGISPARRISNVVADKFASLVQLFALNSDNRAKEGWELVPLSWARRKSVEKESEEEVESMEAGGAKAIILPPAIPARVSTPRPSTPKPRAERRTSNTLWSSSRARSICVPREVEVGLVDLAVYRSDLSDLSPSDPGFDEKLKLRMETEVARETTNFGYTSENELEDIRASPSRSTLSVSSRSSQSSSLYSLTEKDAIEAAKKTRALELSVSVGVCVEADNSTAPLQDYRSTTLVTQDIQHNPDDYTVYNGLQAIVKSHSHDSTGSGHYDGYGYYDDDPFSDRNAVQTYGQETDLGMGAASVEEEQVTDPASLELEAVEQGFAHSIPYQTHALFPIYSLPSPPPAVIVAESRVPFMDNTEPDGVEILDRATMVRKRLEPTRLEPVLLNSLVMETKLDGPEMEVEVDAGPSPLLVLPPTPSRNRVSDEDETELGSIVDLEISPVDTEFERISMPATPTSPSWVDGSSPVIVSAPSISRSSPSSVSPQQRFSIPALSFSGSPCKQTTSVPDPLASPTGSLLLPACLRNELAQPLQTLTPLPTLTASPPHGSARTPLGNVSPLLLSLELTRIPSEDSLSERFMSRNTTERASPGPARDEDYDTSPPESKVEPGFEGEVEEEISSDVSFAFAAQSPPPVHISIRTPSSAVSNLPSLMRRDLGSTIYPSSPSSLQTIPGESPVTPHSIMTIPEESPLTPTPLSAGELPVWSARVVDAPSLGDPSADGLTGLPSREAYETKEETEIQTSSLTLDFEPAPQERDDDDDPPLQDIPLTLEKVSTLRHRHSALNESPATELEINDPPLASENKLTTPSTLRALRSQPPKFVDFVLAIQLRPGSDLGTDAAWALRFLMAMLGWFTVLISRRIEDPRSAVEGRDNGSSEATHGVEEPTVAEESLSGPDEAII